jgi:endogenous inhibitor of DNA gyrase (YacG/DUF329 family)
MSKAYESIKAGLTGAKAHAGRDPADAQADAHGSRDVRAEKPAAPRVVACPSCGRNVEWVAENRYRPFCSARCKGVDLGAWATEKYRVAATEEPHPEDQSE